MTARRLAVTATPPPAPAERIRALLSSLTTAADDPRDPCPACGDPNDGRPVIMCALGPVHVEHDERTVLRYALETVPIARRVASVTLWGVNLATLVLHDGYSEVLTDDGHTTTDAYWLDTAMTLWGLTS